MMYRPRRPKGPRGGAASSRRTPQPYLAEHIIRKERSGMRKSLVVTLSAAALLALGGCKNMGHESGENEMQIQTTDVPVAAMDAFKRDHPNVNVRVVKKETTKNGMTHYEFKYTDANGKKDEAEYDSNGMAIKD